MKEKDIYAEISSIKNLMERSSKFISLSGLSGIMAGLYALAGAFISYRIVYTGQGFPPERTLYEEPYQLYTTLSQLILIGLAVLTLSILTGIWLTLRKGKKNGEKPWNPVSKRLFISLAIPLVTGGIFILAMLARGHYGIVAPACLLFYGLALVSCSHYTFSDIKWLGICEIVLGLAAAVFPGYGLLFWTVGFGFLHIVYGSVMHFKYER